MACYAPCEYKREVSELRKKVELLESGLQTERLNTGESGILNLRGYSHKTYRIRAL